MRPEKMKIAEIGGILAQFNQEFEEDLTADVPGTVREKVRGLVSDWVRRFGLTLPDKAPASLEALVAPSVQDSIEAIGRASEGDGGARG